MKNITYFLDYTFLRAILKIKNQIKLDFKLLSYLIIFLLTVSNF